ncbi:MAG: hypothetical protein O3B73_01590 [bacterium]|nr:hypothetical protein [bacterium]
MPERRSLADAYERILKIADRDHLDLPFKNNNTLRAKHFPGAGGQIGRKKLTEVYVKEFVSPHPNEKLLQHATFPWIHGYDGSVAHILDDLKQNQDDPVGDLPPDRQRALEKKLTKVGFEEIAAFWTVYQAADKTYRRDVVALLTDAQPPSASPAAPPRIDPLSVIRPEQPEAVAPAPSTQAAYALYGSLAFFIPPLIWVGIQFWRLPDESHWIVLSLAALLGLITAVFLVDYLHKRNL